MAQRDKRPLSWLVGNIGKDNLCDEFDEDMITAIGRRVVSGYDLDENSRSDWRTKTEAGMKVAKQEVEAKSFPWTGASNIKYPLIASASIQFAARAYPQIVNGADIVKAEVIGEDPTGEKQARAKRVSQYMSWQCLEQMPEWEPDHDQLLHGLPVIGTMFKKTYFDPLFQRNRSIACNAFEVVVNIKHKGDLATCRRITHVIPLYKNEVIERENAGLYVEDIHLSMDDNGEDIQEQEDFLEQHCWYDCDGDGYEEPYIVTVHYTSGKVARIVANYEDAGIKLGKKDKILKIDAIEYFTKFIFIPDPEGDFYGVGFAQLLGPINESMSTLINQLLDAGALANTGGGFISKGLRWQGGRLTFELGEWKPVDTVGMSLKDSILPLPVRDPSPVLFQLLGLLNEAGNKLAAVSDMMSGETPSQNTPATTVLAVIEQGLKVFTAIYKRIFRSMKLEFKKMYRLNSLYMNDAEYYRVMDNQSVSYRTDFNFGDLDVVPVADPSMASEAQRLARANALMQTMQVNPDPMGQAEILRQYYEAISAKNIDKLLDMKKIEEMVSAPPPPNPDMLRLQLETQKAQDKSEYDIKEQEIKEREAIDKSMESAARVDLLRAQTIEAIANAESKEPGLQMEQYKTYLKDLKQQQDHEREIVKLMIDREDAAEGGEGNEGGPSGEGTGTDTPTGDAGVAEPPSDTGSLPMPPAGAGEPPGSPLGGANLDTVLSGANGPPDLHAVGKDIRSEFAAGNNPGVKL